MAALRYGAAAVQGPQLIAVYDDRTKTILLSDRWTASTPAEVSVVVHELVHHLQNVAKLDYPCPAAREAVVGATATVPMMSAMVVQTTVPSRQERLVRLVGIKVQHKLLVYSGALYPGREKDPISWVVVIGIVEPTSIQYEVTHLVRERQNQRVDVGRELGMLGFIIQHRHVLLMKEGAIRMASIALPLPDEEDSEIRLLTLLPNNMSKKRFVVYRLP